MPEEMKTDLAVPVREVNRIPIISADSYSHLGKYAGALVLSCFEQMGGLPMMIDWASQNKTDFYTKLLPKVIQRTAAVEHSGNITIDDAITRLERLENPPVDAEFDEIENQYDL